MDEATSKQAELGARRREAPGSWEDTGGGGPDTQQSRKGGTSNSRLCQFLSGLSAPNWEMGKVTFALLSWWLLQEKAGSIPEMGPSSSTESGVPGPRPRPGLLATRAPCLCWKCPPGLSPSSSASFSDAGSLALAQLRYLLANADTPTPGPGLAPRPLSSWRPQGSPRSFVRALPMGWFFLGFWSGW